MSASPFLESFIHASYPGTNLPPLWQVIYQEAIRGHHLLFRPVDVARFEASAVGLGQSEAWLDQSITDDLETIVVQVIGCADLQGMINIVDALPEERRCNLYFMYLRLLWMWRHHVKEQLN